MSIVPSRSDINQRITIINAKEKLLMFKGGGTRKHKGLNKWACLEHGRQEELMRKACDEE
jgi:hypothetical protein